MVIGQFAECVTRIVSSDKRKIIAPKASAEGACILMVFGYYGAIGYYGTCDGLLWDVYDGLL